MRIGRWLGFLVVLALFNAALLAPLWVILGEGPKPWLALEVVLLVGVFALLPRHTWTTVLCVLTAILCVLLALVALGDVAAQLALARPLNLYLDLTLLRSVYQLLEGTLSWGVVGGLLFVATLLIVILLFTAAMARLLTALRPHRGRLLGPLLGIALLAAAGFGWWGMHNHPELQQRLALPVAALASEQRMQIRQMWEERATFATEMARAPSNYAALPDLLQGLEGKDVLLAFIESYGVSAVFDPRYAPLVVPRLGEMHERLSDAGLHVVSGVLRSPVQGGQSWLGRGTLISGLWVENQLRYDLLLAGSHETLIHDFRRAGYRTVGVMPAHVYPWPEGYRLGYEQIFNRIDMGYRGPALNWVTMPDQYVWSFLQNQVREQDDPRPLFAEIAFVSSHAPWTPILTMIDWDLVGDGSIYQPWARAGEPPVELWRDVQRVQLHYARSIDYSLQALLGFAELYMDEDTLLIALGDHQPAALVTGGEVIRDVPVHVISGDPALLAPFLDWGFVPGPIPDPDATAPSMQDFRDWFVRAFSGTAQESTR